MKKCKCLKCGYSWEAYLKTPKCCPRCKSYVWNKKNEKK